MGYGYKFADRWRLYFVVVMEKVYIKAISYYLPEKIVTNEDIVRDFPEWSIEKIASKVGIGKRHIAKPDETAMDMAVKAPRTMAEFLDVSGVGETKAARYGEVFLKAIAAQKEDSAHES